MHEWKKGNLSCYTNTTVTDYKCERLKFKTKALIIYNGCRESKPKTKQEILKLYICAYNLKA